MARSKSDLLQSLQDSVPSLWVTVSLGVGAIVLIWLIMRLRGWFREETDPAVTDTVLLGSIREMYRRGELSEAEFRSIKSRVAKSMERASPARPILAQTQAGAAETAAPADKGEDRKNDEDNLSVDATTSDRASTLPADPSGPVPDGLPPDTIPAGPTNRTDANGELSPG